MCGRAHAPAGDVGPQRPVGEGCPQLGHRGVDVAAEPVLIQHLGQGPATQRGEGLPPHTLALRPLVLPVSPPVQRLAAQCPALTPGYLVEYPGTTGPGVDQGAEDIQGDIHWRTSAFAWAGPVEQRDIARAVQTRIHASRKPYNG